MENTSLVTNLTNSESLATTRVLVFAYSLVTFLLWSWVIFGNLLVLLAVWKLNTDGRRILSCSLLLSDLFIGLFLFPLNILNYNIPDMFLHRNACVSMLGFKTIGVLSYIFSLLVANIKSYIQLMWPFRYQNSPERLEGILAAVSWGVPTAVICIPVGIILAMDPDHQLKVCSWDFVPSWFKQILVFVLFVPSVLSLLLVCALTTRIAIRKSKEVGNMERSVRENREKRQLVSRLRAIRILLVMVFILVLTWIPFTVVVFINTTQKLEAFNPTWYIMFHGCLGITALLPVIFLNTQPDIRRKEAEVIRSIPLLGKRLILEVEQDYTH